MTRCMMLHGLGPAPPGISAAEARYWLSVQQFRLIVELGCREAMKLTFDDGNASDIEIALPMLKDAGQTAAFFIPTDRIGTPGYLSEADIRSLRQAGMEIGSHGCSHVRWTELSDELIKEDITRSYDRLSGIVGEPIRAVAVPFGDCNLRVLRVLKKLGVGRVYSSFPNPGRSGAWVVARDCLTADMSDGTLRHLLTREYTAYNAARSFVRAWRHVGPATFWNA